MTKTVTLGEIIESPISGEWGEEGSRIKVLRSTNFTNEGFLNLSDVVTRDISEKKIQQKKLLPGDIIIEKSGGSPNQPVGRVVFFDVPHEEFLYSNFTSVIRPKNGVFPRFLFWFLFGNHLNKQTLSFQNKTTGIINLQLQRYVSETKLPLPPLPRQRQIAAMLDRADSLRQKDRQLLAHYDQLARSTFMDLFGDPVRNEKGWPTESIRSLSSFITDGPFGSNLKTEHYRANGVRVIRLNNIGVGEFLDDNKAFVSVDHYQKVLKKNTCLPGDVVIGTLGEPNLRACIVPDYVSLAINKADCVLCKPNAKKITARYLTAVLNNPGTLSLASSSMRGQTRVRISMGQVAMLKIAVPPIALQQQFTTLIDRIEQQKAMVQQQVINSESLFQRLLQDSFGA